MNKKPSLIVNRDVIYKKLNGYLEKAINIQTGLKKITGTSFQGLDEWSFSTEIIRYLNESIGDDFTWGYVLTDYIHSEKLTADVKRVLLLEREYIRNNLDINRYAKLLTNVSHLGELEIEYALTTHGVVRIKDNKGYDFNERLTFYNLMEGVIPSEWIKSRGTEKYITLSLEPTWLYYLAYGYDIEELKPLTGVGGEEKLLDLFLPSMVDSDIKVLLLSELKGAIDMFMASGHITSGLDNLYRASFEKYEHTATEEGKKILQSLLKVGEQNKELERYDEVYYPLLFERETFYSQQLLLLLNQIQYMDLLNVRAWGGSNITFEYPEGMAEETIVKIINDIFAEITPDNWGTMKLLKM